jgi:hypothetical protein
MKNPQSTVSQSGLTCIEICLEPVGKDWVERAGFEALAHVENDRVPCATLVSEPAGLKCVRGDVRDFPEGIRGGRDLWRRVPCSLPKWASSSHSVFSWGDSSKKEKS